MVSSRKNSESRKLKRAPATTPEARENELIALAMDQLELQLREGTASTPVLMHFAKLAMPERQLEMRKKETEIVLNEKKAEQIESAARMEELYAQAEISMKSYQGLDVDDEEFEM